MTLFPLGRASAIGVAILYLAGCGGSSSTATIPHGHPQCASRRSMANRGCCRERAGVNYFMQPADAMAPVCFPTRILNW